MSIIDHVKDAIVRADNAWDGNVPVSHMEYLARAAVKATREYDRDHVSEAMAVAGCKHDDPLGELVDWRDVDGVTREIVTGVFQAMLNAAISETEG